MLYPYKCEKCGYVFEKFLSMEERDFPQNEPCPHCKKKKVKRLLTSCSFKINGYSEANGYSKK